MLVILLAVTITVYAVIKYRSLFKGYENVDNMFPGEIPLPFVGNALGMLGDSHFVYNLGLKYFRLFRRSMRVWLGPMLYICLQTPQEAESFIASELHTIFKAGATCLVEQVVGYKWKTHRKALTPAFHFKILESFLDIFHENSKVFCSKLEENEGLTGFDVFQDVKLYALDNICDSAMGVSISAQKNPNSEYVKSIKAMLYITFLRCMRPWLVPNFLFRLTSHARVEKKALAYLHGFTRDVIMKRMNERKQVRQNGDTTRDIQKDDNDIGAKKKKVFLDMLLDSYDEGILSVDEVQEQVDTFMFEGHDTVTSAISFALYSMAEHQEYQDKVHQELVGIFGDDDRAPTYEDLNNMKYMEMVIKETLRLYPSVPVYARYLEEDLRLDQYTVIPKGAEAIVFVPCVHRDPHSWERPDEFYPDHFLPELVAKRHPYAHIPFSAGPRNCIGLKFAMLEMKASLSQVIRKFKLLPATPKAELKLTIEVILQSQNGVMIAVERRKAHVDGQN